MEARRELIQAVPIRYKRIHPDAVVPEYATDGSACADVRAIVPDGMIWIPPRRSAVIKTGLACSIPRGWDLTVYSRSGHGIKSGIRLANGTGIIDSDYRGELMVCLFNDSIEPFKVTHLDRIAQIKPTLAVRADFIEVDYLDDTGRGDGGFGSTGHR